MNEVRQMLVNYARRKLEGDYYDRPEVIEVTAGKMIESGDLSTAFPGRFVLLGCSGEFMEALKMNRVEFRQSAVECPDAPLVAPLVAPSSRLGAWCFVAMVVGLLAVLAYYGLLTNDAAPMTPAGSDETMGWVDG